MQSPVASAIFAQLIRLPFQKIFQPKIKYHAGGKSPPKISSSFFGWIPPVARTPETQLVKILTLDAVAFLRFIRLLRGLFVSITMVSCGVLIPFDMRYNLKYVPGTDRDQLSFLTIRDVKGGWLYLHIGMTYGITGLVCGFIWFHWGKMVKLKRAWFRSPEYSQSFYARTLICSQVDSNDQSDVGSSFVFLRPVTAQVSTNFRFLILTWRPGIRRIFESAQPLRYVPTSAHIGHSEGELPQLIENHNELVQKLEKVLLECVLSCLFSYLLKHGLICAISKLKLLKRRGYRRK
jgi:calcium permeable stress-gated cation channel